MPTETPINELPLSDRLAVTRTRLANERTLLAYARTAIMLVSSGAAVLKVLEPSPANHITGWTLIAAGLMMVGFGWLRFTKANPRV